MSNKTAITVLCQLKEVINTLKQEKEEGPSYHSWKEKTDSAVREIFGSSSLEYKELHEVLYPTYWGFESSENIDFHKLYKDRLENANNKLDGYIMILKMRDNDNSSPEDFDAIKVLTNICTRFDRVIRSIRKRYSNRPPLTLEDEYDMQYLLKILLSVSFDDIRPEETTPSYAGTSSRIDFLLKKEKIAIETKMTRKGLADKELTEQLTLDIAQYQHHPDVSTLVCFIYDPGRYVANPTGLIDDIESNSNEKLKVIVIITPMD